MAGPYYFNAASGDDSTGDGSSGNPWKTAQKAATTLAAGEIAYGTGTETLTTAIVPANSGSAAAGRIQYVACNASWVPTIGGWVWNGNSAAANIFKPSAGIHLIELNGIEIKNATSHGITAPGAYCNGWRLVDLLVHNNGGSGVDTNGTYFGGAIVKRGKYYSNSRYGFEYAPYYIVDETEIYSNTLGGFYCYPSVLYGSFLNRCIVRDNGGFGIFIADGTVDNCIIDNNVVGIKSWGVLSYRQGRVSNNCITNNASAGIWMAWTTCFLAEDFNLFQGNGANNVNARVVPAGTLLTSGGNSVDTNTDPYANRAGGDYSRVGASLRFFDTAMPNGVHMSMTAGLVALADFPAVANTRDNDTSDGVTGTLSSNKVLKSNTPTPGNYNDNNLAVGNVRPVAFGLSQAGTLANLSASDAAFVTLEASRTDDPAVFDVTKLESPATVKLRNVTKTGTYSPSSCSDSSNSFSESSCSDSSRSVASGISQSSDSYSIVVTTGTDSIQAQITKNIKACLKGITVANGYNYDVAMVEESRKLLEVNDRWPFLLLLENEPVKDNEELIIRELTYIVWFFSKQDDRVIGDPSDASKDVDTEIAHYNRNALADITKALNVDIYRGHVDGTPHARAEITEILPGTNDLYIDNTMVLFGTWCVVRVVTNIDATNPYQLRQGV